MLRVKVTLLGQQGDFKKNYLRGIAKMEDKVRQRMKTVRLISESDPKYREMLMEMRDLEKQYENVLRILSREQRDVVCDIVSLCEEMRWRMLELACMCMRFPE